MSQRIINRLRFARSTATPAGITKRTYGTKRAKPTSPAFAGECVSERMSSGYAMSVSSVPRFESTWPISSRTKSRLCLNGVGTGADRMT
jgi:hypothetical protein